MSGSMGYWVDLAEYKFDDNTSSTWIHAMPIGNYYHPQYGDINVTPERVKNFADSANNKVRGQDLDIDYDHKEKINDAAGWVKQAEARANGLWLLVDWTKNGLQKLKEKEYRYFSPEFQDEWMHPATKQKFKDVLFGGGLTNRPYMKGILPINMSELTVVPSKSNEGGKSMTPEQITKYATKFGLGADATEEQIHAAIDAAVLAPKVDPADDTATALNELKTELASLKKLSEGDAKYAPLVKLMESQIANQAEMQKQLSEQADVIRLGEVALAVKKFDEKAQAAGFAIPKPALEKLTKVFSERGLSKQFSESLTDAVNEVFDAKLVQLGEVKTRKRNGTTDNDDDAVKKFTEAATKLAKDDNISMSDAFAKAADNDPELYADYRAASYAGSDN